MHSDMIYMPAFKYFRTRRLKTLYRIFDIDCSIRLLDIGGNLFFWELAKTIGLPLPKITIANLHPCKGIIPENVKWVIGDGRNMPFDDFAFDIVFSNSVIEHVGDWASQLEFSNEIRRLAPNYFIQTPCKEFPFEPHMVAPFIHWLPTKLQIQFMRNFTLRGLIDRPDKAESKRFLAGICPLSKREMMKLFPEADVLVERFLGFPKSAIAVMSKN